MTTRPSRWVALIGALSRERRAAHTDGFPLDPEKMLPVADVVLVVPDNEDGSAMLFRYTAHGDIAGDTWHASVDDAKEQALDEYGEALIAWIEVPADVVDAHAFAVQYAHERLDSRGGW